MQLSQKQGTRIRNQYGPTALVSGASSGIGREIARELAAAGLDLVLHARNRQVMEEMAADFRRQYGIGVRVLSSDLGESAGVGQLIEDCGALDLGLAVLSAGFGTSGTFLEADPATEVNMLRVNCESLMRLSHALGRKFVERGRGGLILMSSLVAFQGVPYAAHYAATKAYVQSLSEALSLELRPKGVDVLAAAPGPVKSGFASRSNMQMGAALRPDQVAVPILRALGRKTTVLPGFLTKFLLFSLSLLPRSLKVRVMQKVMGGMTEHQRKTN